MKPENNDDCTCGCAPRQPGTGTVKPADCSCGCDPRQPGTSPKSGGIDGKNREPEKR